MNSITLKDQNGKQKKYTVLFEVKSENWNYIAYTLGKQKEKEVSVYFGKYQDSSKEFKNINKSEEEKLKLILSKFRGVS